MDDRLMTAKQLATYLSVNERTVLKLVADSTLPGVKIGNQWRFRKAMIDTWLDDQMLGVTPRYVDGPPPPEDIRHLTLESCFAPEQILPALKATQKTAVIEELATLAQKLGLVRDRTWLVGALIERENVMPTALGNGLAILHTLRRNPQQVARPFMMLGRSVPGVDFDALDGKPTHLFFLFGLKYEALHLPFLSKIVQMFARPEAVQRVLAADSAEGIFEATTETERQLTGS